jgi:plastocyanin
MLSIFDHRGSMYRRASLLASTLTSVALSLGVVGCGPDGPDVVGGQIVDVEDTDDVLVSPGDSVRIAMTEFEFDPDEIIAEPGDYTGELVNEGAVLHNLTFADGTSFPVPPGESATIEFTVPDGGLTFVCSVEGHEAAGMRGEIQTPETHDND